MEEKILQGSELGVSSADFKEHGMEISRIDSDLNSSLTKSNNVIYPIHIMSELQDFLIYKKIL